MWKAIFKRIARLINPNGGQLSPGANFVHLPEGIGSSGAEAVLNCGEKLVEAGIDQGVWLSAIDTSPRLRDRFEGDDHFLHMSSVPAQDVLVDWSVHPEHWPGIDQHLIDPIAARRSWGASDDIDGGAGGRRPPGALVWYFYLMRRGSVFGSFQQAGVRSLKRFVGPEAGSQSGEGRQNPTPMMYYHQMVFPGGGTGSSMALPINYQRQQYLRRDWGIRDYRTSIDLFLPGNFTHADTQRWQCANTWAMEREVLDHYPPHLQPDLEYGAEKISRAYAPYRVVTLFDVKNDNVKLFTTEEVRQVAAEVWFQKSTGKVGEYYASHLLPDVAAHLQPPNIASAAGASRGTVPVAEIITDGSLGLLERLLGVDYLLREPVDTQAWGQQQVQGFIQLQGLGNWGQLLKKGEGQLLGYDLQPYEKLTLEELSLRLAAYCTRTPQVWQAALKRKRKQLVSDLLVALDQLVHRFISF